MEKQIGLDLFNNHALKDLNIKNAQILSGDKQIKEYAARQKYLSTKRNALGRRKKKQDELMVVGNQGIQDKKTGSIMGKMSLNSSPSKSTQVIPVHMKDGQLVHFPESQMSAS